MGSLRFSAMVGEISCQRIFAKHFTWTWWTTSAKTQTEHHTLYKMSLKMSGLPYDAMSFEYLLQWPYCWMQLLIKTLISSYQWAPLYCSCLLLHIISTINIITIVYYCYIYCYINYYYCILLLFILIILIDSKNPQLLLHAFVAGAAARSARLGAAPLQRTTWHLEAPRTAEHGQLGTGPRPRREPRHGGTQPLPQGGAPRHCGGSCRHQPGGETCER